VPAAGRRWILHVDLDQFLAAVEIGRRPELRGLPVVVGGAGDPTLRGAVATASYEAREFGIHSGMALRTAFRRCPQAVFLPSDPDAYNAASDEVMAALRRMPAVVEVLGWDEAFMEVHTEDPEGFADDVRHQVREATDLSCAVGIGDNKSRAKTATGFAKPGGVFRLTASNWMAVMGDRPTDALWGIGTKTARKLAELGIRTVRDLAAADPRALAARFGPAIGPWLWWIGRGEDRSAVNPAPHIPKSRSREVTFQQDLADWSSVQREVAAVARRVAADVAADGRPAARVGVKIRFAPFFTHVRSRTLPAPTLDADVLAAAALEVLGLFTPGRAVRLVGVRAEFAVDCPPPDVGPAI
jgi:DNA polymerase-4